MASAYLRYVSTEATTALASIANSSMPTREILTQTSTTIPLSRIRSITSTRLEDATDFSTAMFLYLLIFSKTSLRSWITKPRRWEFDIKKNRHKLLEVKYMRSQREVGRCNFPSHCIT